METSRRKHLGMAGQVDSEIEKCSSISCSEKVLLISKKYKEHSEKRTKSRQTIIMISCFITHIIVLGLNNSLGVIYVELISEFDALRSEAALVQSVNLGTMFCVGILFTRVIERFGPGMCSIVGMTISAASVFISVFSPHIYMVIVFVGFFAGLGMSVTFMSDFIAINRAFKTKKRTAMAIVTLGSTVAQFSFPYITEYLLENYYWNGTFLILSGIVLNSVPFGLLIHCSEFVLHIEEKTISNRKYISGTHVLKNAHVIFVLVLMLVVDIGILTQVFFTVDLTELRGYERKMGATLYSLLGLSSFIGRSIATVLLTVLANISATFHYTYGLAVFGIAHFLVIYFKDYWRMLGGVVLQGYSSGVLVATFPGVMIEQCGADIFADVLALSNVLGGVIDIVGGFLGGYIADNTGGYNIIYYVAVGSTEIGAVITATKLITSKLNWCHS